MRAVLGRLHWLEDGLAPVQSQDPFLVVVTRLGRILALDNDARIQILRECGFLRGAPVRVVDLSNIPDGLNAAELERFLRENGAWLT
jgi:hypothetical protein